jgi:LemA protein
MTWIVLLIIVALVIFVISIYNSLVKMRIRVNEAWSDIDVQLKRRYDLIPNLIETVKGYAKHEKETLDEVVEARAQATKINVDIDNATAEDMAAFSQAQQGLSGALGKLFALSENYPDLKANQNFLQLQNDLTDTEDKIQAARRFYNGTVREYNTKIATVPSNIVAGLFNFKRREFFEAEDNERQNVSVKF